MSTVPKKDADKVAFYENHIAPWNTNAVAIGLTTTIVTDIQAKTASARAALTAQQEALQDARAATTALRNAIDALDVVGANSIKQIRATAERTLNPAIYSLAQIPAPATPGPRANPGTPYEPELTLDGDGALILKWKCNNPTGTQGTMYMVYRSIGGSTEFAPLGGSGTKEFVDNTIPLGATQITYKIQAVRSTAKGPWATFNVYFGTNAGGQTTATIGVSPARIAA